MLACVVVLLAVGCSPAAVYIEADRATFDVIAQPYLDYVNGDASLDDEQRDRRARLIDTWRIRIEQAEGSGGDDV